MTQGVMLSGGCYGVWRFADQTTELQASEIQTEEEERNKIKTKQKIC